MTGITWPQVRQLRGGHGLGVNVLLAGLVIVGCLLTELAYGVGAGDALAYAAYELGFVVLPGWLLYRVLASAPGGALRQLALGWALGYALEILFFLVTAAAHARGLFPLYPPVVGLAAVGVMWLQRSRPPMNTLAPPPYSSPRLAGLTAALCLIAVLYVAFTYFAAPLPGATNVHYSPDTPWQLSLAADAKYHWPIQDPNVAGEPLPYHFFVHVHMAAASNETGVDLAVVFLRLFIVPLIALSVLLFVVAGRSLWRSAYTGIVAGALVLLVGGVALDFSTPIGLFHSFRNVFFAHLASSPSFTFGVVLYLPLLILIGERLRSEAEIGAPGDWILLALLGFGASNAKVTILPILLVALALYSAGIFLVTRRLAVNAVAMGGVLLVIWVAVYVSQYSGHSSGLVFDPSSAVHFFTGMPAVMVVSNEFRTALPNVVPVKIAISVAGIGFGAFGLFGAQLAGLPWVFWRRRVAVKSSETWLLANFTAAMLIVLAFRSPASANHLYFLDDALIPGCLVSAQGLRILWSKRPPLEDIRRRMVVLGIACAVAIVALIVGPPSFELFSGRARIAHTYMLLYGGLAIVLGFVAFAATRWIGSTRWPAAALITGALVLAGACDVALNDVKPALDQPSGTSSGRALTPALFRALTWLRDRTPTDSVIAVNNGEALEFDYPAFSERRTFFGGWGYSQRIRDSGFGAIANGFLLTEAGSAGANMYPDHLALNDAVFERASHEALATMRARYGVRYLLIDEVNGYRVSPDVHRLGRTVYQHPGVWILQVAG